METDDMTEKQEQQAEAYDTEQQELAAEFARHLVTMAVKARGTFCDHALATALVGAGVQFAITYMPADGVAAWLRDVADAIEREQTPPGCAGSA